MLRFHLANSGAVMADDVWSGEYGFVKSTPL